MALLCGLLVVQLSLAALAGARTAEGHLARRAETLAALRVARAVLRRELRAGLSGRDWVVFPPDSIRLRAFRAVGRICPDTSSSLDALVAWEGVRRPDPEKDSVLLLSSAGHWSAADLVGVSPTGERCPASPGAIVDRWRFSLIPPGGAVLARVFERGSYHVSGGAVRYRRGLGGRQPLTPQVLDTPPSGFVSEGSSISLELVASFSGALWTWRGFLASRAAEATW